MTTVAARVLLLGVELRLETDVPEVTDYLDEVGMWGIADFEVDPGAAGAPEGVVRYLGREVGSLPSVAFTAGGSPIMTLTAPWSRIRGSTMLRLALLRLSEYVRQGRGEYLVHAAAVEVGNRALVLVGGTESGKTSMALHLCRRRGARLLANDQAVLALGRGRHRLVRGDPSFNFRAGSLARVSPALARRTFGAGALDFHAKRRVAPAEVDVAVAMPPVDIGLVALVRADAGRPEVTVERAGTGADPTMFTARREAFAEMSSLLRASDVVPLDERLEYYDELFLPSIDTPALALDRVRALGGLIATGRLVRARGPVEKLADRLLDLGCEPAAP